MRKRPMTQVDLFLAYQEACQGEVGSHINRRAPGGSIYVHGAGTYLVC